MIANAAPIVWRRQLPLTQLTHRANMHTASALAGGTPYVETCVTYAK